MRDCVGDEIKKVRLKTCVFAPEDAVVRAFGRADVDLSLLRSRLTTAKPRRSKRRPSQHQPASSYSSSSSRTHPGPSSKLLSDSAMTPWGGPALYESSFTSIPSPPPPPPPLFSPPLPPTPPAPRPTPSTPYCGKQTRDRRVAGVNREASPSAGVLHRDCAGSSIFRLQKQQ